MSNGTRTLAKEQPHHEKAFEYYYGLGEKRSYNKVAKEFNVSVSTVKLWGKSLRWKERLKELLISTRQGFTPMGFRCAKRRGT